MNIFKALVVPLLAVVLGCSDVRVSVSDLRSGDLLFVVNGQGNNITDVTEGVDGLAIDHVAIFADGMVVEAIPEHGVWKCPLDSFLVCLSVKESVLVGRVAGLDVESSVNNAEKFIGKPYDDIFMPSDSAIYCSELVQKSFVFKNKSSVDNQGGKAVDNPLLQSVFGTIPMSFHDSTGNVTEFWTKFYASRGLTVPEGEQGSNPGQLSRDPNVNILGKLSY